MPCVRSAAMAPPKKGPRRDGRVRMPEPLKAQLQELVRLHGSTENDEMIAAILAHIRRHDPATCRNILCEDRRRGGRGAIRS